LTSTEGAALQDILYVLKKNYFCGEVLIKNCSVQGMHCPKSVSEGINYFNKIHEKKYVDVLIIARGGGSFEDLIGYSSKEIVKSIYKSNIYIISAIGHEVDNMLSDFSANLRAPTPSIAGELLSASKKKEIDLISTGKDNLAIIKMKINNILSSYKEKINSSKKILNAFNPTSFINLEKDKLLKIKINIFNKIKSNLFNIITKIEKYTAKNNSYSPNKIFENGYVAIVDKNNNLINKLDNFKQCKKLKIIFIDGEFELNINK
jgi:exodeoxyribonuclease VII large subunit